MLGFDEHPADTFLREAKEAATAILDAEKAKQDGATIAQRVSSLDSILKGALNQKPCEYVWGRIALAAADFALTYWQAAATKDVVAALATAPDRKAAIAGFFGTASHRALASFVTATINYPVKPAPKPAPKPSAKPMDEDDDEDEEDYCWEPVFDFTSTGGRLMSLAIDALHYDSEDKEEVYPPCYDQVRREITCLKPEERFPFVVTFLEAYAAELRAMGVQDVFGNCLVDTGIGGLPAPARDYSPVSLAAELGDLDLLMWLQSKGADLYGQGIEDKKKPICFAFANDRVEVFEYLLPHHRNLVELQMMLCNYHDWTRKPDPAHRLEHEEKKRPADELPEAKKLMLRALYSRHPHLLQSCVYKRFVRVPSAQSALHTCLRMNIGGVLGFLLDEGKVQFTKGGSVTALAEETGGKKEYADVCCWPTLLEALDGANSSYHPLPPSVIERLVTAHPQKGILVDFCNYHPEFLRRMAEQLAIAAVNAVKPIPTGPFSQHHEPKPAASKELLRVMLDVAKFRWPYDQSNKNAFVSALYEAYKDKDLRERQVVEAVKMLLELGADLTRFLEHPKHVAFDAAYPQDYDNIEEPAADARAAASKAELRRRRYIAGGLLFSQHPECVDGVLVLAKGIKSKALEDFAKSYSSTYRDKHSAAGSAAASDEVRADTGTNVTK